MNNQGMRFALGQRLTFDLRPDFVVARSRKCHQLWYVLLRLRHSKSIGEVLVHDTCTVVKVFKLTMLTGKTWFSVRSKLARMSLAIS
jgi:hypothetical protein